MDWITGLLGHHSLSEGNLSTLYSQLVNTSWPWETSNNRGQSLQDSLNPRGSGFRCAGTLGQPGIDSPITYRVHQRKSPNLPICTFIKLHGGSASSTSITEHFKNRIMSKDMLLFENLLKQMAMLQRGAAHCIKLLADSIDQGHVLLNELAELQQFVLSQLAMLQHDLDLYFSASTAHFVSATF
uniref:Uncharacterized protein n=1 Tax=Oryza punctata TaxID=4537 RepID=A0A0E0LSL9_ORYPU